MFPRVTVNSPLLNVLLIGRVRQAALLGLIAALISVASVRELLSVASTYREPPLIVSVPPSVPEAPLPIA